MGGSHSILYISIVNIVTELDIFLFVRLDWFVHANIVCNVYFSLLYKKKLKCKKKA